MDAGDRGRDAPLWVAVALLVGLVGLTAHLGAGVARLSAEPGRMDFDHFYWAGEAAARGEDVYGSGEGMYVYPPLTAAGASVLTVLDRRSASLLWFTVSAAVCWVAVWVGAGEVSRRLGVGGTWRWRVCVCALAVVLLVDSVRGEFRLGQTDTVVLLALVLGLRWVDARPVWAGAALGLVANIKYVSLVMLPYLLIRRRWAAAGSMCAWTVVFALAPAAALGWEGNLRALGRALSGLAGFALGGMGGGEGAPIGVYGLTYERSVSIPSAAGRFVEWVGLGGAWGSAGVVVLVGLCAGVCVGAAALIYRERGEGLWRRWSGGDAGRESVVLCAEWCGLVVVALVFSPLMFGRHAFLLLLPVLMGAVLALGGGDRRVRVVAWVSVLVGALGLVLPPGEPAFASALRVWRAVSGASWCVLLMYAGLLWAALASARGGAR